MGLADFAQAPEAKPEERPSGWDNLQNEVGFIRHCLDNGTRLPYAGISFLKIPEHSGGLMRGQHGSSIVKSLPLELQPVVCRADGTYHEKAQKAFKAIPDFDSEDGPYVHTDKDGTLTTGLAAMANWPIVPAAKVKAAYEDYLENDAETESEDDEE